MRERPGPEEHDSYYAGYVELVPDGDVLETLERQLSATDGLLARVPASRERFRYSEGKWSLKDVVAHVIDAERVFAFRALAFARRDPSPLPSFEQDDYVAHAHADRRSLADLRGELGSVRAATVTLFAGFEPDGWSVRGMASGRMFTVRSLAYIIAGHERHHRRVLEDRYL